jgi:hypothetical protein
VDGTERAFFGTDATANAETFRYEGNLGIGANLYTEATTANNLGHVSAMNQLLSPGEHHLQGMISYTPGGISEACQQYGMERQGKGVWTFGLH